MIKNNFSFEMRRLFFVILSTILYVIGVKYFIVPGQLLTGGITGFSILITMILEQFNIPSNLGLIVFILNIPVLIIGLIGVSRKFFYYTMFSIILQSILLGIATPEILIFESDRMANALFGGMIVGVAAGLCLKAGASLGGMDVVSQFLALKKQTSVGMVNLITNGFLLVISILFFDFSIALYTLLAYIATNVLVDKIHTGYKRVKVEIITAHGDIVKEKLLKSYVHGITIHDGIGAFTGNNKKILSMVTQSHEVYDVKKSVLSVDEDAFITITPVRHLSGQFNQIIIK